MATDCEQLSAKARKFFEQIIPHFGKNGFDPWNKPVWEAEGIIHELGSPRYDLRKSADRQQLIERTTHTIGHMVEIEARSYRTKHGSLENFDREHFPKMMFRSLEILHLLNELDFQIETMDLVESS
jgi:hypothetical protein